jgi:hypothetical protein
MPRDRPLGRSDAALENEQENRMRQLASAICLATTLLAAPVSALETFTLRYEGTGHLAFDCFPVQCLPFSTPWTSTVTLQTVSGADGVYSLNGFPPNNPANTLTFLSLVSDNNGFVFDVSTQDTVNAILSATIQGGRVTSIDGSLFISPAIWRFAGVEVTFDRPLVEKSGPFSGQASMVPEPGTYALMLAGLAAGLWARRRTERST